jgi:hypothetical protein
MVGRAVLEFWALSLGKLFGKTLYANKRDASHSKHHAQYFFKTLE